MQRRSMTRSLSWGLPFDLSSLENNLLVMEILDAARLSAAKGIAVSLL
jgi:hypothetical protein